MSPRRLWITALALPVLAGLCLRASIGGVPAFPTDDAYISLHAARHLFAATDPSYGTPPLTGATSPLHVVALAALIVAGMPPLWAVEVLCWLGALAFGAGVTTLVLRRVKHPIDRLLLLCVAWLVGHVPMHLANGQETGWAMAAAVWLLVWLEDDTPERVRIPVMAALLPALRPELGILSALLTFHRVLSARARIARDLAIVAAGAALWAGFNVLTVGAPLPNTVNAKRVFFASYALAPTRNLFIVGATLVHFAFVAGPAAVGLVLAWRPRADRVLAAALAATVVSVGATASLTLDHNFFRYLHPLAVASLLGGLASHVAHWRNAGRGRAAAVALALSVGWVVGDVPEHWRDYRLAQRVVALQSPIAEWLSTHVPAATVLVHDAGYLSEFTRNPLVDLVGLKTPASTAVHAALTGPSAGRRRGDAVHRIACGAPPPYYVAFNLWERFFGLTRGLTDHGWLVTPVLTPTVQGPVEPLTFTLYAVTPPAECRR